MKRLVFTVTNDLTHDQRMQRICTSLANAGYQVSLIGRTMPGSMPFNEQAFSQKRLPSYFSSGKLMYLEYNIRLFFFLLVCKADLFCAIDLDTILPVYFGSRLKNVKRVYDAHELFTEQKEIVTRPAIHKMWLAVEKFAVSKFRLGYTVNNFIVNELNRRYGVVYSRVRNLPTLKPVNDAETEDPPFIIYQGAVNEGRSFETLIPAMTEVNARLIICGNGNFFNQVKQLIAENKVQDKVELRGYVAPDELARLTPKAFAAVMLFENNGLNQYYSLANRFFDYIMACVPQVCVDYPEYKALNDEFEIASLISNTNSKTIATSLNNLLADSVLYNKLRNNCLKARQILNWQQEEKVLLSFYQQIFSD